MSTAICSIVAVLWYQQALSAPDQDGSDIRVLIEQGETSSEIASKLRTKGLIRSETAFNIYVQTTGTRAKLQAGGYILSTDQNVQQIVDHLVAGKADEVDILISPSVTLNGIRKNLQQYGYSSDEIDRALSADYEHPLLASKPDTATLEGYIYPETYRIGADQTLEDLFEKSFDELYEVLTENGYLAAFQARSLSIHQGLTLSSIVQKEVDNPSDQKQVAQVFLSRLAQDIQLGSDVTFIYAAEQAGQQPTVNFDSPYNTRINKGIPPGPIANMQRSAIDAVASPAPGDFLYFVAGDDGKTYFSRTEAEHNANVAAHCIKLCQEY